MPKSLQNQDMIRRVLSSRAEACHAWVEGFFRDCRVRELSPYTIENYRRGQYPRPERQSATYGNTRAKPNTDCVKLST